MPPLPKPLPEPEPIVLTPVELSRAATGQRFYSVTRDKYEAMAAALGAEHGYPKGAGTKAVTMRAIPLYKDAVANASDKEADLIMAIPEWMYKDKTTAFTDAVEKTEKELKALVLVESRELAEAMMSVYGITSLAP